VDIGPLPKIRFAKAAEAVAGLDLSPEAKKRLTPAITPGAFLKALLEEELLVDAIRLMAIALPRREAVWWACLLARRCIVPDAPPEEMAAIEAAEAWVYRPTEENRRATFAPAQALDFRTAGSYAALAAYWSGGSIAPPEAPVVVPPGDGLTGTAAAAAVLLAAATVPAKAALRHRGALERAIDIANGGSGRIGDGDGGGEDGAAS
jgi:hypothetical protein